MSAPGCSWHGLALAAAMTFVACSGATSADPIAGGPRQMSIVEPTLRGVLVNAKSIFWLKERTPGAGDLVMSPRSSVVVSSAAVVGSYQVDSPYSSEHPPVVVNDTYAFWTREGVLYRHRLEATATLRSGSFVMGRCRGSSLALDDTYVYWVESDPTRGSIEVLRQPIEGGIVTALAFGGARHGGPFPIAVDDEHVYFGIGSGEIPAARIPKQGGAIEPLPMRPAKLAVDGTSIYWSELSSTYHMEVVAIDRHVAPRDMKKMARTLGPGTTFALGDGVVFGTSDGKIWRAPKAGGGLDNPLSVPNVTHVTVAGQTLYFGARERSNAINIEINELVLP